MASKASKNAMTEATEIVTTAITPFVFPGMNFKYFEILPKTLKDL